MERFRVLQHDGLLCIFQRRLDGRVGSYPGVDAGHRRDGIFHLLRSHIYLNLNPF